MGLFDDPGCAGAAPRAVLAVYAHPDDAELGSFGLLARLGGQGYAVHIVDLTVGGNSSSEESRLRRKEAARAAELLGAERVFGTFQDGAVPVSAATHAFIGEQLSRIRPEIVVTHYDGPLEHQDHRATSRVATLAAQRQPSVKLIMQSEPSNAEGGFAPNLYVDVTEYFERKLDALRCYGSEATKPFMAEAAIRLRGSWRARQSDPFRDGGSLISPGGGALSRHAGPFCESFLIMKARVD